MANEAGSATVGTVTMPLGSSAIADLFGLSSDEAALVEDLCLDALSDQGLDGERLLHGLRSTGSLGGALGLAPDVLEAIYARAHRWFAVGHPEKAEPLFRTLCVAEAGCADYWVGLGLCLRLSDRLDMARTALETAARLRHDWAVPHFHLCELLMLQGNTVAAAECLVRFGERASAEIPPQMKAEATRFERAIEMRGRS